MDAISRDAWSCRDSPVLAFFFPRFFFLRFPAESVAGAEGVCGGASESLLSEDSARLRFFLRLAFFFLFAALPGTAAVEPVTAADAGGAGEASLSEASL